MFGNNGNIFDNSNFNVSNDVSNFNNEAPLNNEVLPVITNDIPPELDEIKGLNDATKINAPTMDVLGPMNLMPEKTLEPADALTQYENGLPNVFEIPSINNNQFANNEIQNEDHFTSFFNRPIEPLEQEQTGIPLINTSLENDYEIVNDIKIDELETSVVNEEPVISEVKKEFNEEEIHEQLPEKNIIESSNENFELEEEIISDEVEEQTEESTIVDVEKQVEETTIIDDTNNELISDKILKIREYIDSLNLDVKIEEYDFEELYQLIIKIKK